MNDPDHFKGNFPLLLSSGKLEKEAFSERDRELFLEICGVERLSRCVTTEAQTELYRPCPALQTLVRQLVPYIQRFIFHHADFEDMYSELKDSGIAKRISSLSFGQVRFLPDANPTDFSNGLQPVASYSFFQNRTVCVCAGREAVYSLSARGAGQGPDFWERGYYLSPEKPKRAVHPQRPPLGQTGHRQVQHLPCSFSTLCFSILAREAHLSFYCCRELVKLFTTEKTFAKELERFLQGLVTCINVSIVFKSESDCD